MRHLFDQEKLEEVHASQALRAQAAERLKDCSIRADYLSAMAPERPDPGPTRATLLVRLKNWEDQESWKRFFDTYWKLIYTAAVKSGLNGSEAEEVVQETLVTVARTISSFKYDPSACSFKTWLLHLTRKRIVDQFRRRLPMGVACANRFDGPEDTPMVERVPDPSRVDLGSVWEAEWRRI